MELGHDGADREYRDVLHDIEVLARHWWKVHGHQCPLEEYIDAGHEALARCLQSYSPDHGASFRTYARYRIRGMIQDAPQKYTSWRNGRFGRGFGPKKKTMYLGTESRYCDKRDENDNAIAILQAVRESPPLVRRRLELFLQGYTMKEIAEREGVTESAISLIFKSWLPYGIKPRQQHRA